MPKCLPEGRLSRVGGVVHYTLGCVLVVGNLRLFQVGEREPDDSLGGDEPVEHLPQHSEAVCALYGGVVRDAGSCCVSWLFLRILKVCDAFT